MLEEAQKMSAAGWKMTARWTILGTLCCVLVSVGFSTILLNDLEPEVFQRGIRVAIALPILMAGPLFFYLTVKLRELSRLNHRLHDAISYDHLTQVLNRGAFIRSAKDAIVLLARGGRGDAPHNLYIIADIDHFKHVNDKFGHPVGDAALQHVAKTMRNAVRSHDYVGRLGGEEFGILLTQVKFDDAHYIADRIRRAISNNNFIHESQFIGLTVSIGGIVFQGDVDYSQLYKSADAHLYAAKESGRNRSVIAHYRPAEPAGQDIDFTAIRNQTLIGAESQ